MLQQDYLRLSLILNESNSKTVKTNILKIIKAVIYTQSNTPLTISKIAELINSMFSLEFTPGELVNALKKGNFDGVECVVCEDPVYSTYRLTPDEYKKVAQKMYTKPFDDVLEKFIQNMSSMQIPFEDVKSIIIDFLYKAFSADVSTIKSLLGRNYDKVLSNEVFGNVENDKKGIINDFLNWDNIEKNKFVYNAISCGFEYCMLGLKKDNSSLSSIFNGKSFYLDSNVIFRLMGLNRAERKNVIDAFIKKCLEAGIAIKYTNITLGEIESTIDYHVGQVRRFYGKNTPISREALQLLSGKYANLDFIDEYGNWARTQGNVVGDYDSFNRYLKKLAYKVLLPFKMEPFESYDNGSTKDKFQELFCEFEEYKKSRYKMTYEGNISVDVNNYLFIRNKNGQHLGENVLGINFFIISTDHVYIDWAKTKLANTIPIIVLPSVWYSIILKYMGRSNDDYNAFSQFLKFRINEADINADVKNGEIFGLVLNMKESSDTKEEILFDIESKLKNEYRDIESAEEIVQLSTESVIQKRIEITTEKIKKESEEKIERIEENHNIAIEKQSQQKFEFGMDEGARKTKKEIYEKIVKNSGNKVKIKLALYWVIRFLFWLMPLSVGAGITYFIFKNNSNDILKYISFSFGPILTACMNFVKGQLYLKVKDNTNKKFVLQKIVKKRCEEMGIEYYGDC